MNRFLSWFCEISIAPLIKWLFIKEIAGEHNIKDLNRNFILVSNHQSYLDILIDGCLCTPRKFRFIGQTDGWHGIMRLLIKGLYFIAGVIPVDRKSKKSRKNATERAIEILRKGDILVIYPEGTRSLNGTIQEGELGVAKIFLKTEAPIVPAGIIGTFELFPPKGKLKIDKIVKVNIGNPIFFEKELKKAKNLDENSKEYHIILQELTSKIMKEIHNLTTIP
jgi:1-acyl-sn-glycerol-3-phosphate acyltransferase